MIGVNKIIFVWLLCWILLLLDSSNSFIVHDHHRRRQHHHDHHRRHRRSGWRSISTNIVTLRNDVNVNDNYDDNDYNASDNNKTDYDDHEEDWRSFRAKLVLEEQITKATPEESSSSSSSSSWAYDAGNMIEKGTILVSRIESTLGCHDLRQPYFAKCVILIVEHDDESPEEGFTQGIILNRPSNLYLDNSDIIYLDDEGNPLLIQQQPSSSSEDDDNDDDDDDIKTTTTTTTRNKEEEETKVKMFFGGDLASIFDDENDPLIVCLHNNTSEIAQSVSEEIIPGIYLTSHLASRGLIEDDNDDDDDASTTTISADDFYTFGGFCGWDPGQLSKEIERGSWYLISASKDIIWNELQKLRNDEYDPRNVGIEFWQKIVNKIDNYKQQQQQQQNYDDEKTPPEQQQQQQHVDSFAELMLKEWATEMLMVPPKDKEDATYIDDKDIYRALKAGRTTTTIDGGRQGSLSSSRGRGRRRRMMISAGSLLRASHHEVSPFLLQNQFLHKSILLLLQETDSFSVGLVLNLPTKDTYEIPLSDGTIAEFTIRYGGPAGNNGDDDDDDDDDENPLIWLHNNDILKQNGIGKPVGGSEHDFDDDEEEDDESTTKDVVWTCSVDQVIEGIESNPQITPNDFMVVKGFCVWEKQEEGSGGIMGQLRAGNFDTIQNNDDNANIQKDVWSILRAQQRLLDEQNLETNLRISSRAWHLVGVASSSSSSDDGDKNIVGGDGRFVFNTTVPVTNLADTAMEAWMKIYLLGNAEYYW